MAAHTPTPTRICRVLMGLAVLWGITGLSALESWAIDDEISRATLRGVSGVMVVVESFKPDVERAGLTTQRLQTDVELQLRKAGIRIFTNEEIRTQGQPSLYIRVTVLLGSNGLRGLGAFNIDVAVVQLASLYINASIAPVVTWSISAVGTVGIDNISTVRSHVRDHVDEFINAYLSVNSPPSGSATPSSASSRRDLIR